MLSPVTNKLIYSESAFTISIPSMEPPSDIVTLALIHSIILDSIVTIFHPHRTHP